MELNGIIQRYDERFKAKYKNTTTKAQWSALNAMLGCRSGQYGKVELACEKCEWAGSVYQSCGHRACNQCQHHVASQWLERQQHKLLPVKYFMVTFTIPFQLRQLALLNQTIFYTQMFKAAFDTLKQFGQNDKELDCELGMIGPTLAS